MKALSLEARVGLMLLAALAILVGFLLVLGDVRLGSGATLHVDFDNPGAVRPGAPVLVAGTRVGRVEDIAYLGPSVDRATGRRALVRLRLSIDREVMATLRADALFYVTSQSVLGEQVVAIDPGSPDAPPLREGSVVRGVDPPRLDLALALGYELLEALVGALRENRDAFGTLLQDVVALVRTLRELVTGQRGRIESIVANVETASGEAARLVRRAREHVESRELDRALASADRALAALAAHLGPLLDETRRTVGRADEVLATVGPDEREAVRTTLRETAELVTRANEAVGEARQIVAHVRAGRGTVGALLIDEEIYDDVQELLRDLKHNPWKLFWRE
ncbi:MAG: MlaD family protein [Myxococcales bacterium]|nr:MlaD family protein [Myxococcales bacterium]